MNRYDGDDVFQQFYIKMIELRYKVPSDETGLKIFCYATINHVYNELHKKNSAYGLEYFETLSPVLIKDDRADKIHNIITDKKKSDYWLEMSIFEQAQNESLRSIERKTNIPIKSLARYYNKAVEILKQEYDRAADSIHPG